MSDEEDGLGFPALLVETGNVGGMAAASVKQGGATVVVTSIGPSRPAVPARSAADAGFWCWGTAGERGVGDLTHQRLAVAVAVG
ncbi:hypothetical protein AB0I06_04695 [Streptomyces sp. NPDC050674]|uniref:hypothetical protein n=1 Tax=Streptomyces sp. NPDC050674 TaxID=3157216 RepID=UPI00343CF7B7